MWHVSTISLGPWQSFQPSCEMQVRTRLRVPPPHCTEQALHLLQAENPP